ncbi:starch-binding protein [Adhaeribacter aerolatus]|uniref:Starch-binding protein n=2 Tax=Adhaeribacter aerolatus TaxID=670289 RepID=A0A512AVJ2_9BACT|nr:starch-binding protein [Adhaeribacter aerolatus]
MSCEDFLETPPVSDYSSENLFQTVEQARMTTYGIYYTFTHDIYSRSMNTNVSNDTDEMQCQGSADATARRVIARYNTTPSNTGTDLKKIFDRLYAGIERANICIERIPKMNLYTNGTEAEKNELKRFYGEALALRAYYYFDLIKLWGDIPFKTTPSQAGENFFVDRTSRDIIFDQIIQDMKQAVDLVPWRKDVAPQARWTKGAVKGMLARIALHAAGYSLRWDLETKGNIGMRTRPDAAKIQEYYQLARDQTWDVINDPAKNHQLNPSFENIWRTLCGQQFDNQYGESMFEIGFWNPTGEQAGNGYIGNKIGVPVNSAVIATFGKGGSEVRVLPTYTLSFKPEDNRKAVTVADFNIDATGKRVVTNRIFEYNPGKWRTWWATRKSTGDYTGINHILLRYSDVLLMFAEADSWLKKSSTPEAINALKQVRKRAYKGKEALIDTETYPTDFNGFLNVLVQERAWELGTEGLRKWDLIRWNKLTEVLTATQAALKKLGNDTTVPLYVYYLPVADPEQDNPKVFGNATTIPAPYSTQGYIRADYRNGLSSNVGFFAQGFEPNKDELFPIMTASIGENPSLSQHPGF